MIQRARVVKIDGDNAVIVVYRSSACGEHCAGSCAACRTAKTSSAVALNTAGAAAGDMVEVETPSRQVMLLSFLLYIVPMVFMIGGYCVAAAFGGEDVGAVGALAGFFVGFIPSVVADRAIKKSGKIRIDIVFDIVRVINPEKTEAQAEAGAAETLKPAEEPREEDQNDML